MIFMAIFWVLTFIVVLLSFAKKYWNYAESLRDFLVIMMLLTLFAALSTKDPLFTSLGIDPLWEISVELLAAGFAFWKAYLNPLKGKVYSLDRELREIKSGFTAKFLALQNDVEEFKNETRRAMQRLEKHIDRLQ